MEWQQSFGWRQKFALQVLLKPEQPLLTSWGHLSTPVYNQACIEVAATSRWYGI